MNNKSSLIIIAVGVALVLAAFAAYVVVVKIPSDLAAGIAKGVNEAFNFTPQVKMENTVVIEQTVPITELAIVSRDISVDYTWSHEWLGSTKTIALRGTFTAKAGFDLREPFAIEITKYPITVRANMPAPQLLSVQMNTYKILEDESGWWNRITNADRELAVAALQHRAREEAINSGMLAETRAAIEARIAEIVRKHDATIDLGYSWRN
ncbi:MAG: DUF4230 domain-containing protein [Ignavibacteriae bacterium]|nr:DUF4230 domain-containing protein [Ignavibacteriota bacterium]